MTAYYGADDFGLSNTGDRAVLELAAEGTLHGASVLATHLTSETRVRVHRLVGSTIDVGLHFNLTEGPPISSPEMIPSLVNEDGHLFGLRAFTMRMLSGRLARRDIETELRAQWQALAEIVDEIAYIDGHQHIQYFPVVCDQILSFLDSETSLGRECLRLGQFRSRTIDARTLVLSGLEKWLSATRTDVISRRRRPFVFDLGATVGLERSDIEVVVHPAHPEVTDHPFSNGEYDYPGRCAQFIRLRSEGRTQNVEYDVADLDAEHRAADVYMEEHPNGCFGHTRSWRDAIMDTYRIRTHVLTAKIEGQVVGVAPWSILQGPLGGRYMLIAPFASYGGVLADNSDIRTGLLTMSTKLARDNFAMHLHLRAPNVDDAILPVEGRVRLGRYISPRVPLSSDPAHVWKNVIAARARTAVRKAQKSQICVEMVEEDWSVFGDVFAKGMRDLGSPFHGVGFFRQLEHYFGDRLTAWIAWHDQEPAAAALAIRHGDALHYVYGQNVRALRKTNANSLLVWTMIEQACREGLRWVDLGRSEPGTPQLRFKEQWGGVGMPIDEAMIPVLRRSAPDLVPTNPKFAFVRRTWSRLPLPLTRQLGPLIIRGIG